MVILSTLLYNGLTHDEIEKDDLNTPRPIQLMDFKKSEALSARRHRKRAMEISPFKIVCITTGKKL